MLNSVKKKHLIVFYLLFVVDFLLCQNNWSIDIGNVGTFSSPRMLDINDDGIKDIILGAGREEFIKCDSAVVALNGSNGQMIWSTSAEDQIFGSALFYDANGDHQKDILIGGRSSELIAIEAFSGKEIWRFNEANINLPDNWYNFYNAQTIYDINGDNINDIIVSNGGDVMAKPFDTNRKSGSIVLLDGANGKLLKKANMPDGKEIYMSIVVDNFNDGNQEVVFGTGGETIGGHLYKGTLDQIMRGDLSDAVVLDSSDSKGFIGPPALVDITNDGVKDIIATAVDGRLLAFDGKNNHKLWEVTEPKSECYSSVTVGQFTNDGIPDFFISFGQGVWPELGWCKQKMINGATGKVEFEDSLGYYQTTSCLAVDLNNDNIDEVIMSVNFRELDTIYRKFYYTSLVAIEFKSNDVIQITDTFEGSNLSSTPWIGDLDDNGYLDIVFTHGKNLKNTYTFDGIKVHRMDTQIPITKPIKWGSYQGSNYDGIYNSE